MRNPLTDNGRWTMHVPMEVFVSSEDPAEPSPGGVLLTVQPNITDFSWTLKKEILLIRWHGLKHLVGERFLEELVALDDLIFEYRPL